MQLIADVTWAKSDSVNKMDMHLAAYKYNKKANLKKIFGGSIQPSLSNTEISIRCGEVQNRSSFVFVKGGGNTSQLTGYCPSNRLDHLCNDFKFLSDQMKNAGNEFEINDVRIKLNDEKLVKKNKKEYFFKRSVLVDLATLTGIIPLSSSYLLTGEITSGAFIPVIVGFIFWLAIFIIGYRSEPEYVLKKG